MPDLAELAARLAAEQSSLDPEVTDVIASLRQPNRKNITKSELRKIAEFKNTRFGRHLLIDKNSESDVIAVSTLAFSLEDEALKMRALCLLNGVAVPVGSAILGWCFPSAYPVIDQRAWRTLNKEGFVSGKDDGENLGLAEWLRYLSIVRKISALNRMRPQEIDIVLYWLDKMDRGPRDI